MAVKVTWLGKASDKIESGLMPQLSEDLRQTFPQAAGIAVYDCFAGYSQDQPSKIVLGVEIRSRKSYNTHVVKLGKRDEVSADYDGWQKCILRHNFASRIFVSLDKKDLRKGRTAVVYQDAYRLFGSLDEAQGPQMLETVANWAIRDDKPDPVSVERVIRQLYTDLYRWFYRSPRTDSAAAMRFYKRRLRKAAEKWSSEQWRRELRRDVIWLLCSDAVPDAFRDVAYLDPYDYVTWALQEERIPQTLVGRSHGDLHGRNILVGVQRGEAEYPAVFDYGEMSDTNVIVWDFVKLESELKVRLLLPLYKDGDARDALLSLESEDAGVQGAVTMPEQPSAEMDPRSLRAEQLAFAFRFESILASLTRRIYGLADPEALEPPGGRNITGNKNLDRALGIVLRIRQEAALFLGDRQPQRGERGLWRDEYYFALAAYGLCTAKFDYKETETAAALVSAGVAVAQLGMARDEIGARIRTKKPLVPGKAKRVRHPYPSYHVPLAHAHRTWKAGRTKADLDRAVGLLSSAEKYFEHAVPLHQEYVLLLAEAGMYKDALRMLGPMEDICRVFRDEETLCRIGRICKDLGDRALADHPVPPGEMGTHSALQWYQAALKRYREAFQISSRYYPGVNAATLALLAGRQQESKQLASQVISVCHEQDLSTLHVEDCFWVLVSQGEAQLLMRKGDAAANCYHEALTVLPADRRGMAQSVYNQLCRLAWALGPVVKDSVTVFREGPFELKKGPLGNCAGM